MSVSPTNARRGFALLEVLIAFAIASMALGVLFQVASGGGSIVRSAGQYEEAVSRAKSHLAAVGRDLSMPEGEQSGDDGGGYRWRIAVAPKATVEPEPAAEHEPPPPGAPRLALYTVDVAISWTVDGRRREVMLHSERLGMRKERVDND